MLVSQLLNLHNIPDTSMILQWKYIGSWILGNLSVLEETQLINARSSSTGGVGLWLTVRRC